MTDLQRSMEISWNTGTETLAVIMVAVLLVVLFTAIVKLVKCCIKPRYKLIEQRKFVVVPEFCEDRDIFHPHAPGLYYSEGGPVCAVQVHVTNITTKVVYMRVLVRMSSMTIELQPQEARILDGDLVVTSTVPSAGLYILSAVTRSLQVTVSSTYYTLHKSPPLKLVESRPVKLEITTDGRVRGCLRPNAYFPGLVSGGRQLFCPSRQRGLLLRVDEQERRINALATCCFVLKKEQRLPEFPR